MLAEIEAKYARDYALKLQIARAEFEIMLHMALQQSSDAALMAIDDVFDVNPYSAEKFHQAHIDYVNKIAHMTVVEDDDPEIVWTKETVDRRIRQIVGEERFMPWEDRYAAEVRK